MQFSSGDRVSSVIINQNFANRKVTIGQFHPNTKSNGLEGKLYLNASLIKWASGQVPQDTKLGTKDQSFFSCLFTR